jgi:hypothetical protein
MNSIEICKTRFAIKNINYLTRRESALVELLSKGLTVKEIAEKDIVARLDGKKIGINHIYTITKKIARKLNNLKESLKKT